jgi:enoyl-[acyl-carrier protein] reductase I
MSIAWKVAEKAHAEGARFTLFQYSVSIRLGTVGELAEKCGSIVIPADATSVQD